MAAQGVYPVYNCKLKVGVKGLASSDNDLKEIAELESIDIKIDAEAEEWKTMSSEGWASAMLTAKAYSIEAKGKRSIGDPANDYIFGTAFKNGLDCGTKFNLVFPDGGILKGDVIVNVASVGGGEATAIGAIEFTLKGNGKPQYVAATPANPGGKG